MLKILNNFSKSGQKITHLRMSSTNASDPVLFEKRNHIGSIVLNRPKQLNALNLPMAKMINEQMAKWEKDDSIRAVLIKGSGETAFCAGGDVKHVRDMCMKGEHNKSLEFFREEYSLNYRIATYSKPYIALINGITMGGGVGLSVPGRYRIATEKTLFAIPETQIGFFSDASGSYFMPRFKDNIGLFLVLTGTRLKGQDVRHTGIATHFVSTQRLGELETELDRTEGLNAAKVEELLAKWDEKVEGGYDMAHDIARIFNAESLEKIIANLEADGSVWAQKQLKLMLQMSPTSLKVAVRQFQLGLNKSLKECLQMEYQMAQRFLSRNDYMEGVRCLLIDRNSKPKWEPNSYKLVDDKLIDWFFTPLPDDQKLDITD